MEFRLLGTLEVVDDGAVVDVGTSKHRALLAILLIHANELVATEVIVDQLWGGNPPPSAVATLRGYLSNLRQGLEPGSRAGHHSMLKTRPSGYILSVPREQIDVARFEDHLREGREAMRAQRVADAALAFAQGLALWRGPPLADFTYHPFAQAEAARLAEARLAAEEGRMTAELALGHHHEVVDELATIAGTAPFREHLWGLLILALYRCGRQGEALRTYQRLRAALADELGIEPSPELRELEHAVLVQDDALTWRPPVAGEVARRAFASPEPPPGAAHALPFPPMLAGERGPFVGRQAEEALLLGLWSHAREGRRQVAFVSGEAGIGKSRLAEQVARQAHEGGGIVLYGRCDEEVLVAHQPFIEALSTYVGSSPLERLQEALGPNGPQLAKLLPAVAHRFPALPKAPPAEPETERYRLFEAVTDLLTGIARSAPVLLVLDDLHWADRPTLLLVRHLLLRGPDDLSLMVLGLHRDDEPGATGGLAEVLSDARRRHPFERIPLTGFSDEEVAGVIEGTTAGDPGDDVLTVARAIRHETDGNPLFVEEVVRHLREIRALDDAPGGTWNAPDVITAMGIPAGVREVVTRRLSRLSPSTRQALAVAAVIGTEFEFDLLDRAAGLDQADVVQAIDEAASAHLVTERSDDEATYGFCHAVVRASIYGDLTGARRAQLHAGVAAALEDLAGGDPDAPLAQLAYHLGRAGRAVDAGRALDYAQRAAQQALAQVAYEQAAQHYRQALDAQRRQAGPDPALRCELLLSLGDAHNKAGQLLEGKEVFGEAAETARRLHAPEQLGRAALGYLGPVPVAAYVEDPTSVSLVEEALAAIGPGDNECRALLLGRLAQWLYRSKPVEERRALCDEAVAIARRLGDPTVLACVLSDRHWALFGPERLDVRIRTAQEIRDLGRRAGNDELTARGLQCLVHAYLEKGDMDELAGVVAARDRLAEDLRQPHYLWNALVTQALRAIYQGRFAEASALVERSLAHRYRADPRQASNVYLAQQFMLHFLQGRLPEQAAALSQLLQRYPSAPIRSAVSAWFLAETGQETEARAALDAFDPGGLTQLPRDLDFYPVVAGATVASFRLREPRLAAALYDALFPFADRNCVVGQSSFLGAASYFLGLLAGLSGNVDGAVAHLVAALSRHLEMGARPFVALTQFALASALVERDGPTPESEDLLHAALDTATLLGMAGLLHDARQVV